MVWVLMNEPEVVLELVALESVDVLANSVYLALSGGTAEESASNAVRCDDRLCGLGASWNDFRRHQCR